MNGELSDLRLQLERLVYESKEAAITTDAMREQNVDLAGELEELRVSAREAGWRGEVELIVWERAENDERAQAQSEERFAGGQGEEEGREDGADDGSSRYRSSPPPSLPLSQLTIDSQGGMSEKEAEIRASLARLDEAVNSDQPLSQEDISMLRRQLEDSHVLVREQQDRSKQVMEENEILVRRKEELEGRLATLETEYEELLGTFRRIGGRRLWLMDWLAQTSRFKRTSAPIRTFLRTCRTSRCAVDLPLQRRC